MHSRTNFMDITDATPERMRAGVALICEGRAVECDGVSFAVVDEVLQISVACQWPRENLTEVIVRREIERAGHISESLAERSSEFRERFCSLPRRYSFVHDDGMAAVELCHLEGDTIVWSQYSK